MNKRNLTKGLIAGFLMVSMVLTGCQWGQKDESATDSSTPTNTAERSSQEPADVVKAMQMTWGDEMSKIGELDGKVEMMVDASGQKLDMMIGVSGSFDASDLAKPLLDLNLQLQGEAGAEGVTLGKGDVDVSMKMLEEAMYLKIDKFDLEADEPQVAMATDMIEAFVGSWYELPAEALDSFRADLPGMTAVSAEDQEMQDAVMAVAQDANLFKVTKDMGMDGNNYHYAYEVDKEGFTQFMIDVAEASGEETPSEEELEEFKTEFAKMSMAGELWINADTSRLERMVLNISGDMPEEDGSMDLMLDFSYTQLDSVSIEAPESSQPFPL